MSLIPKENFPKEYLNNCIDFNQQLFNFIELAITSNSFFFDRENSKEFQKSWEIFKSVDKLLNQLKELRDTIY